MESSPTEPLISILGKIILKEDDFNAKYENFIPNLIHNALSESTVVREDERVFLERRFKQYIGKVTDPMNVALQREIHDLKLREYPLYNSF